MKAYLLNLLEKLRDSYLFIPILMLLLAISLSAASLMLDRVFDINKFWWGFSWIYVGDVDGARAVLSSIASSMITVAGVLFSVTMLTLSLASSQFGPSLLRNFLQDMLNQFVLGAFIATYIYCLLVLRDVEGKSDYVPNLSVTLAVAWALLDVALLIIFIHNTTASIRIDNIIATAGLGLCKSIERHFPDPISTATNNSKDVFEYPEECYLVMAPNSGYIQGIDKHGLVELATHNNVTIQLEHRPGDFIVEGSLVAKVWATKCPDKKVEEQVHTAIFIGRRALSEQDVEFEIRQLVQVAVRALSPGINDPFTANICLDHLGAGLALLAKRALPEPYLRDGQGTVRLVLNRPNFSTISASAFDPIRQSGINSVPVVIHFLKTLTKIAFTIERREDGEALHLQAERVRASCIKLSLERDDFEAVERHYNFFIKALSSSLGKRTVV